MRRPLFTLMRTDQLNARHDLPDGSDFRFWDKEVVAMSKFKDWIGHIYPTTYFVTISRGTFSKVLDFGDVAASSCRS